MLLFEDPELQKFLIVRTLKVSTGLSAIALFGAGMGLAMKHVQG